MNEKQPEIVVVPHALLVAVEEFFDSYDGEPNSADMNAAIARMREEMHEARTTYPEPRSTNEFNGEHK